MNISLAGDRAAFENVKWRQVLTFLDVLSESEVHREGLLKRRYCEQAEHYAPTLNFLLGLGLLKLDSGSVSYGDDAPTLRPALTEFVISRVLASATPYRDEIVNYLAQFSHSGTAFTLSIGASDPAACHWVRNFLIEGGALHYSHSDQLYVVEPQYNWAVAVARSEVKRLSPSHLKAELEGQEEIGRVAELAVVDWERRRLGRSLESRVAHVSESNAAAGYDVLSVTVHGSGTVPRFIEVKAVSGPVLRFYWTQNEVKVAAALGSLYHLYLVPVKAGVPSVDEAKQIADPYNAVLGHPDWQVEESVLECQLRPTGQDSNGK